MRRALLLTGIAAGTAVLVAAASIFVGPSREDKIKNHLDRVRDLAFCQKAYEIASSFPSYESRKTNDPAIKKELLRKSDALDNKSKHLENLLTTDLKDEAVELGLTPAEYDDHLDTIKEEVEVEAVDAFKQAEEPQEILDQLEKVCSDIIT